MIAFWHTCPYQLQRRCPGCTQHQTLRGRAPCGSPWTQVAQPYPAALCDSWSAFVDYWLRAARSLHASKAFKYKPVIRAWDATLGYRRATVRPCSIQFVGLLLLLSCRQCSTWPTWRSPPRPTSVRGDSDHRAHEQVSRQVHCVALQLDARGKDFT